MMTERDKPSWLDRQIDTMEEIADQDGIHSTCYAFLKLLVIAASYGPIPLAMAWFKAALSSFQNDLKTDFKNPTWASLDLYINILKAVWNVAYSLTAITLVVAAIGSIIFVCAFTLAMASLSLELVEIPLRTLYASYNEPSSVLQSKRKYWLRVGGWILMGLLVGTAVAAVLAGAVFSAAISGAPLLWGTASAALSFSAFALNDVLFDQAYNPSQTQSHTQWSNWRYWGRVMLALLPLSVAVVVMLSPFAWPAAAGMGFAITAAHVASTLGIPALAANIGMVATGLLTLGSVACMLMAVSTRLVKNVRWRAALRMAGKGMLLGAIVAMGLLVTNVGALALTALLGTAAIGMPEVPLGLVFSNLAMNVGLVSLASVVFAMLGSVVGAIWPDHAAASEGDKEATPTLNPRNTSLNNDTHTLNPVVHKAQLVEKTQSSTQYDMPKGHKDNQEAVKSNRTNGKKRVHFAEGAALEKVKIIDLGVYSVADDENETNTVPQANTKPVYGETKTVPKAKPEPEPKQDNSSAPDGNINLAPKTSVADLAMALPKSPQPNQAENSVNLITQTIDQAPKPEVEVEETSKHRANLRPGSNPAIQAESSSKEGNATAEPVKLSDLGTCEVDKIPFQAKSTHKSWAIAVDRKIQSALQAEMLTKISQKNDACNNADQCAKQMIDALWDELKQCKAIGEIRKIYHTNHRGKMTFMRLKRNTLTEDGTQALDQLQNAIEAVIPGPLGRYLDQKVEAAVASQSQQPNT